MATKKETVDFILEQLEELKNTRTRNMFGEYALYCDEKVVGLICDNQLFIKLTEPGMKLAKDKYTQGLAYPGAKPSMNVSENLDDSDFLCELIQATADALPRPKKK